MVEPAADLAAAAPTGQFGAAEFRDQLDFGREALRHRALIVGGLKTRSKLAARGARRWS